MILVGGGSGVGKGQRAGDWGGAGWGGGVGEKEKNSCANAEIDFAAV